MENKLLRYSRAGDEFHYRWAARRCLKLIYAKSPLQYIVIEGSGPKERELAGEYVIDLTEYLTSEEDNINQIVYYQLKHTTVQADNPFNLSDLKDTIEGFARRYAGHFCKNEPSDETPIITFSIVTNRPISQSFKNNISIISHHGKALGKNGKKSKFQKTIEKYTQLKGPHLQAFCALIEFADSEGDYNVQREQLRTELALVLAGTVDNPQLANIIELVRQKVMPDSGGKIVRENVLQRFGVTSERELFPAPPAFEKLDHPIKRVQYDTLLHTILSTSKPIIIHAGGGVGKSVAARHLADSLPVGSLGIVYDCFGGGKYRNRSELRHRHRDALVQIANQLASDGLCAPLIAQSGALEDQIMRQFLMRIASATSTLRKANENAILVILIDAADNAEMAAQEFSQSCFVHELLREQIPSGCRLVALCRTERIDLLQPTSSILKIELTPFTKDETLDHLKLHVSNATEADGLEFHRLTSGNPRVQANALAGQVYDMAQILATLGPLGTTVSSQIAAQLDSAIAGVKNKFPLDYQSDVDAICVGLATLPPFIPLSVLATAAQVTKDAVKSLISDLGRPLWLSDTSVQFRDEPTETWFRERFSATAEQVASYVARLKPLAQTHSYVAESLPLLLLQAQKYDELVNLALSDELLPEDNPIDERNVRVYRLQFAFKAALKLKKYADATKLAMRAGEEVAGNTRQLALLRQNVDLIAPLQNRQRVQELAFRHKLRGEWDGSENVYSAALLSSVDDFKGEARGYLRAADNWLRLYFEERKKNKNKYRQKELRDGELVELMFAHYNLFGADQAVDFLLVWQPPKVVYRLASRFIRRLVDAGHFDAVDDISQIGASSQYLMIAVASELIEVGRFPSADSMQQCLVLLSTKRTCIAKPTSRTYLYDDAIPSAIVSFAEACAARKLPKRQILRVLQHFFPVRASRSVSSHFPDGERDTYLRVVALKSVLSGDLEPNLEELLPEDWIDNENKNENKYKTEQDIREFKEVVGGMLPWYMLRVRLLIDDIDDLFEAMRDASRRSKGARANRWRDNDTLPYEISEIQLEILTLYRGASSFQVERFYNDFLKEKPKIWIPDRLNAVRAAFRSDHLLEIRGELEKAAFEEISSDSSEGPETRAEWYIDLARAVLSVDHDDAAAYFDYAIEAVSKFGDEMVERWEAVAAIANRAAEGGPVSPEMAYRFIRSAELIGDNVAREKHFNRNGAIKTCARLSPSSAFTALSRWRDRDVGWFKSQLSALALEAVNSDILSPAVGWSLSAFFDGYGFDDFASLCLSKESSVTGQQLILNTAIRDLRLKEATESSWQKLKQASEQYAIDRRELDRILDFYANRSEKKSQRTTQQGRSTNYLEQSEQLDWAALIGQLELTTSSGLSHAIQRFNESNATYGNRDAFWQEVYHRIDKRVAVKFLEALVSAEKADKYDVRYAISQMPSDWRKKVSVKRHWKKFLSQIAQRFASSFTNHYIRREYFKAIDVESSNMPLIHQGIIDGLSSVDDLVDARTFFGFVEIGSSFISPQQGAELLDFALTRFELHIGDQDADGNWANWLMPPDDVSMAFTGFVWAALGSPRSEIRWQAAHCVRRLAEAHCKAEIDALMKWMARDDVGAFGSHKFPFYNLHARQYLLIALARVSIDHAHILKPYHDLFAHHALENIDHLLIQKFSAAIALNIENAFPNTYSLQVIEQLHKVGVSQLPVKQTEGSDQNDLTSLWGEKEEANSEMKFYHGYDFDRYWFEPLGRVFGISGQQVEELATEIVLNEWQVDSDGRYYTDPRAKIWQTQQNERETWHSHGSYPHSDNHSFYLSYHSMFVVASRLLQKMPVVHSEAWHEDSWSDWLQKHMLTRSDGYWLSDRRDPAPLIRRAWIFQDKSKNWRWQITPIDFLDGLLVDRNGQTWLNVYGWWEDGDDQRKESFRISSALVSPTASQSLLNALTTCPPNDFKLPEYKEEEMEFDTHPFELQGWVSNDNRYTLLDEYDPHAGTMPFPPYQIGELIAERLQLTVDLAQREWHLPKTDKASIICQLWGTNKPRPNEDGLRQGQRLSASLDFLRKLCTTFECELIFEVRIRRQFRERSYSSNKNETGYTLPYSKIYLLSADGNLRDTRTHFQLR